MQISSRVGAPLSMLARDRSLPKDAVFVAVGVEVGKAAVQDQNSADGLTHEQVRNLAALAAYLDSGPALRFDMTRFAADSGKREIDPETMLRCGAAACALGHGPFAGLPAGPNEEWKDYAHRVFGVGPSDSGSQSPAFLWMFGAAWAEIDNSPTGAAARIRWFLANGVPENSDDQQTGDAPLSYLTGP